MKNFQSFTDVEADETSTLVAVERIEVTEDGDRCSPPLRGMVDVRLPR